MMLYEMVVVKCYGCNRYFFAETDIVKICPYCKSRKVVVDYSKLADVEVYRL